MNILNIKNLILIFGFFSVTIATTAHLYANNNLYFVVNYDNSGQWGFEKALSYKLDYEIDSNSLLFLSNIKYYSGKKIKPKNGYYGNIGSYFYKKIKNGFMFGGGGYYSYHHTKQWSKNLYLVGPSLGYTKNDIRIEINFLKGNIIRKGIEIKSIFDVKKIRIYTELGFYDQKAFRGKRGMIGIGIKIF